MVLPSCTHRDGRIGSDTATVSTVPSTSDLTLSEQERRTLIVWAVECVRRVLPLFESTHPDDDRLHQGLVVLR
ncbi:putative immunity protein [Kineococcus arenarius]